MIYFDNASTSFPKPQEVYDFMDQYYRNYGVNIGRGQHLDAFRSKDLLEDTRLKLLNLFKAPENKTVVFTASATEAINLVLQGQAWKDGMTVYITPFEHNAVLRTLHYIKKRYTIKVLQLAVNKEDYHYNLEQIKEDFQQKKPDMIIMSHASNVIGKIAPIEDIARLGNCHKAITIIDMAQTAGLVETDMSHNLFDYVVFAGHKTLYGPFGIGGIILSKNSPLKPLIYGGTGFDSADSELPRNIPEKFETGSMNIQAIAGLNKALEWIENKTVTALWLEEKKHILRLLELLKEFPFINIYRGKDEDCYIGLVACNFENLHCDYAGLLLNRYDISIRTGLQCAPGAHEFIDTFPEGTLRFSISYFTSEEDFVKLKNALNEISQIL